MELDKIIIGARIREIREELLGETRKEFAKRCNLTDRHVAQIERGEFLFSLKTLNRITTATGIDTDYILYGKGKNDKTQLKELLYTLIDRADKDELHAIYRCITTVKSYISKKEKN